MTTDMTKWKTAHCPDCGREMPCYYSIIDEELTIYCSHCSSYYKVRRISQGKVKE